MLHPFVDAWLLCFAQAQGLCDIVCVVVCCNEPKVGAKRGKQADGEAEQRERDGRRQGATDKERAAQQPRV